MARAQSATGPAGVGGGASRHMVARHADILRDYTAEFHRTRRALSAAREAADGLAGARGELLGVAAASAAGGAGAVAGGLYAERASLSSAGAGADAALSAGAALREDLERQRQTFVSMVARMDAVGERVPGINRLIGQIRRKRKRDLLVMAAVVAILLFLTGVWMLA